MPATDDAQSGGAGSPSDLQSLARDSDKSPCHHREAIILATAHDIIARACGWRVDQAADALLDVARRYHLDTVRLAGGLLELLHDLPMNQHDFHGPAAIAFEQWGTQLQRSHLLFGDATQTPPQATTADPQQPDDTRPR